jgi:hypothetical protein
MRELDGHYAADPIGDFLGMRRIADVVDANAGIKVPAGRSEIIIARAVSNEGRNRS